MWTSNNALNVRHCSVTSARRPSARNQRGMQRRFTARSVLPRSKSCALYKIPSEVELVYVPYLLAHVPYYHAQKHMYRITMLKSTWDTIRLQTHMPVNEEETTKLFLGARKCV